MDSLVIDHLIHVVARHGPDDLLAFLVVPDLGVLVEGALTELVELSKGSLAIHLFLLFALVLNFACGIMVVLTQDVLSIGVLQVLLCVLYHKEHVGIELTVLQVFWLEGLIRQHLLEDAFVSEELELAAVDDLKQRHHADLALVGHE